MPPFLQYALMAWCSVKEKHRDNFTFMSIMHVAAILMLPKVMARK